MCFESKQEVNEQVTQQEQESVEEQIKQADFELLLGITVAAPMNIGPSDTHLPIYLKKTAHAVELMHEDKYDELQAYVKEPDNYNEEFHTFAVGVGSLINLDNKEVAGKAVIRLRKMVENLEREQQTIAA